MQLENRVLCHWDFVRFVTESHLKKEDGTFLTLSVTEGNYAELMLFLGKTDSNSGYEVRVYKNAPGDKYIPREDDNVQSYEENDEYATFFFDEYETAHNFIDMIGCHPEYRTRPIRKIDDSV